MKSEALDQSKLDDYPGLSIFKDINPATRTLMMFAPLAIMLIPFVHPVIKWLISTGIVAFLLGTLIIGAATLVPAAKSWPRRHPLMLCLALLIWAIGLSSLVALHNTWFLLSALGYPLVGTVVQAWLNRYWQSVEPVTADVRHGFNIWELLLIILGGSLFGLNIAGSMIGVKTP